MPEGKKMVCASTEHATVHASAKPKELKESDNTTLREISAANLTRTRSIGSGNFGTCYPGKYRGIDVVIKQYKERRCRGGERLSKREANVWRSNTAKIQTLPFIHAYDHSLTTFKYSIETFIYSLTTCMSGVQNTFTTFKHTLQTYNQSSVTIKADMQNPLTTFGHALQTSGYSIPTFISIIQHSIRRFHSII